LATAASAETASSRYSASISGVSYFFSSSEKMGSVARSFCITCSPSSRGSQVSSNESGTPSARRTRWMRTTFVRGVSSSCFATDLLAATTCWSNTLAVA
jgi:hypothetical protein